MLCFFYGRNPKNFQQDTVLQHARMYGARSKEDMAVTRFHTTSTIYRMLVRMNELDNQLREWFLEGRDKDSDVNAVFVGYDKHLKPCAAQKIKASNALTLKPQMRMVPAGFWTGSNTAIKKTIAQIDSILESCPAYGRKDEEGFFEIGADTAKQILQLIESTFVYKDSGNIHNLDRKNDIKEMLCALDYCASKSDGKVLVLLRTHRNMNRLKANGTYNSAPDAGNTDDIPARQRAIGTPVLMLFRQEGQKFIDPDTGENIGWNDAPFYWPVLMSQKDITPVMYAFDQRKKDVTAASNIDEILKGYDRSEVLYLTFKGDLVQGFGAEGAEYNYEDAKLESRGLKDSTASRYILKNEDGSWMLNSDVPFDEEHNHGLYSYNNGKFPFVLKPYRYMLLGNKRDYKADLMLMELFPVDKWKVEPYCTFNADGDLVDSTTDNDDVLMRCTDKTLARDMSKTDYTASGVTQWVIEYHVRKVLRFIPFYKDNDDTSESEEE